MPADPALPVMSCQGLCSAARPSTPELKRRCQHEGMASLYAGGRWCPQCGAEYRPGFVECADCRVRLTDAKPDPAVAQDAGRDHDQLIYDLAEWSDDRRRGLTLLLTSESIAHGWEGSSLLIPRARQEEVDDLMAFLDAPPEIEATPKVASVVDAEPPDDESIPLAGPGRRLVGCLLDRFVVGIPTGLVLFGAGPSRWAAVVGLVISPVYEIVGIALWGRTLGKLAARTRVVLLDGGAVPGWPRATIRWAVPAAFGLAALVIPSDWSAVRYVPILGLGWGAVVYMGLLMRPLRQGLHDRGAGTVVVVD